MNVDWLEPVSTHDRSPETLRRLSDFHTRGASGRTCIVHHVPAHVPPAWRMPLWSAGTSRFTLAPLPDEAPQCRRYGPRLSEAAKCDIARRFHGAPRHNRTRTRDGIVYRLAGEYGVSASTVYNTAQQRPPEDRA